MLKPVSLNWRLMLPLLVIALSGCAQPSLQPSAVPARVPSLPTQARVSLVPMPSMCLPSCTANLRTEQEKSLYMLTGSESPVKRAKLPTIR